MKKSFLTYLSVSLSICLIFLMMPLFSGCKKGKDKLTIVCTIYPQYDWASKIVTGSDNFEVIWLEDNGADLHNYQATTKDIATLCDCDILVYVGGESDSWIDKALLNSTNPNMIKINMLSAIGNEAKAEHELEEIAIEGEEGEEGHDEVYDEHVWLSIKNAITVCEQIKNAVCAKDPANASRYTQNANNYISSLNSLDDAYTAVLADITTKNSLVFTDRFPFLYLTQDYNLNCFAAFFGCSAETEARFSTITTLAQKIVENNLTKVLITDSGNLNLANTVINTAHQSGASWNIEILTLDSLQSVTIHNATGYIEIMLKNLGVLKSALTSEAI